MATAQLGKPVNVVWVTSRQFDHVEKTTPSIGEPARRQTFVSFVL
jgi:hypothetical protein